MSRSEAERLRHHRMIFERAQADGVDMGEAARRLARDRWAECKQRLEARRCCGTRVSPVMPSEALQFSSTQEGERELAWWQK